MSSKHTSNVSVLRPTLVKDTLRKFIARQPIFSRKQEVYGYELLFRSGLHDFFDGSDPEQATYTVIADSLFLHGLEMLTENRKAFINCTREVLLSEYTLLLPKENVVLEIVEGVEPDPEVLAACRRLKDLGYCLTLDDVCSLERPEPFLGMVDMIKVEFPGMTPEQREEMVRRFGPQGIIMLAEKVETRSDFDEAAAMGYQYFQGYFFSEPQLISSRDIPAFKLNYLRILQAVHCLEIDLREIERIIKTEPALCYKLLRYLNSPVFGFRGHIRSIRHAVSMLGENEIRCWVSLLALASMGEDKPAELVVTSLIRASWCESLAAKMGRRDREGDFFLLGLFSMIDAILDRPLSEVLAQLPVPEEVQVALLQRNNRLAQVLGMVEAYERGEWDTFTDLTAALHLDEASMPEMYLEAVDWAHQVFRMS
ncbi:MAG: HDOD domain-containing protein [Acidobacteria bacterium]|nr:HDOD domain-containing protein [Acidobacteriota bacterium]